MADRESIMGIQSVWLRCAASLAGLVTLLALLPAAPPARVVHLPVVADGDSGQHVRPLARRAPVESSAFSTELCAFSRTLLCRWGRTPTACTRLAVASGVPPQACEWSDGPVTTRSRVDQGSDLSGDSARVR